METGNWKLTRVTCDADESQVLTNAALADPAQIVSTVTISGTTASRLWTYYGCQVATTMSPLTYDANSTLTAKDGAAQCGTGCGGTEPFCTNPLAGQSISYGWQLPDANTFSLSLPAQATNGNEPCGAGQGTGKILFYYSRR